MVSVSRRCLHLIRVLPSITHVLKNTLNRARVQRQRGGQVGEKENERGRSQGHGDAIIRCFDLGFMCRPCVGALCLSAPQRDMTAWVVQLITKFFKAKKKKKKSRRQEITQGGKTRKERGAIILRRTEKEWFWFTNEVQRSLWTEAVFQDSSLSKCCFLSFHWNLVVANLAHFSTQS